MNRPGTNEELDERIIANALVHHYFTCKKIAVMSLNAIESRPPSSNQA